MLRRRFVQMMTLASAGSLAAGIASVEAAAGSAGRTVSYLVKGFTCVTCATGLDTLLGRQKGILSSQSTYPEGKVTVRFNPDKTDEKTIVAFIGELGFHVQGDLGKS